MASATALKADPGPRLPKYAITLANGLLYKWVPDDATTEQAPATYSHPTVVGHTGGWDGRWLLVRFDDRATDLTDAAQDIYIANGRRYVVALATLGAARAKTLKNDGAAAGDVIRITRLDVEAFDMTVVDEASTLTIFTFPASESWFADFRFDGTNWSPDAFGQAP